jgi:hypothetical protein
MPNPPTTPPRPQPAPPPVGRAMPAAQRPLRFSMRTLLVIMTLAALATPLLIYSGIGFRGVAMMALFVAVMYLPTICLGALALYCRGYRQTLFLGAFAGAIMQLFIGTETVGRFFGLNTISGVIMFGIVQLIACGICGLAAMAVRRQVERRGWNAADDRQRPADR